MAIGDLDRDGALDLLTANWSDKSLSLILGNGDGTFQPATLHPSGGHSGKAAIADLDGDGQSDALALGAGGDAVSVLRGLGEGVLAAPAPSALVGNNPVAVALPRLNQDAIPDLVTANSSYVVNLTVRLGRGDGTFDEPTHCSTSSGRHANQLATGDVNLDGYLDVVVADSSDSGVDVLLGSGDGALGEGVAAPAGAPVSDVAIGDFDGDGLPDLAVTYSSNVVGVLRGAGDGSFAPGVVLPAYRSGVFRAVAIADLDVDGIMDIVAASSNIGRISVLRGVGNGDFEPSSTYPVGQGARAVVIGDLDGDRIPDVATANSESHDVSVLLGNGDGSFPAALSFPVAEEPYDVTIGDFDGDGALDLATANYEGNSTSVLLGRGDGSFLPAVHFSSSDDPYGIAAADLDGDLALDLVTANSTSDDVRILLNASAPPVPFLPPLGRVAAAVLLLGVAGRARRHRRTAATPAPSRTPS